MRRKETVGCLATVEMAKGEKDIFVKYFKALRCDGLIEYLDFLFGEDELLEFLDVFAGKSIRCPSREWIMSVITNIRIYTYIEKQKAKDGSVSEELYKEIAIKYRKRRNSVRHIYEKTKEILTRAEGITSENR